MTNQTERIVVHEANPYGIRAEGRYRPMECGKVTIWVLTHWRIRYKEGVEFSEWYKVHGNQKKPCAGFALIIDS